MSYVEIPRLSPRPKARRSELQPFVTFTRNKQIQFSLAATTILRQAGIEAVTLFWDQDERKLAMKAVPQNAGPNAYRIFFAKGDREAQIGASRLVRRLNIDLSQHVRLPLNYNADAEFFSELTIPAQLLRTTHEIEPERIFNDRRCVEETQHAMLDAVQRSAP